MRKRLQKTLAILAVITLLSSSVLPVAAEESPCTEDHDHSVHTEVPAEQKHVHTEDCAL